MPRLSGSLRSWARTYPECSPRDERLEPERAVPVEMIRVGLNVRDLQHVLGDRAYL